MIGIGKLCVMWTMVALFAPVSVGNVTVDTSFPTYKNNPPKNACDGDLSTYFWSSRRPKAGDHFTLSLDAPVTAKRIRIINGKAGDRDKSDMMVSVNVDVAGADGVFKHYGTFVNVNPILIYPSVPVKAIRLRPNEQKDWIVVREVYFEK